MTSTTKRSSSAITSSPDRPPATSSGAASSGRTQGDKKKQLTLSAFTLWPALSRDGNRTKVTPPKGAWSRTGSDALPADNSAVTPEANDDMAVDTEEELSDTDEMTASKPKQLSFAASTGSGGNSGRVASGSGDISQPPTSQKKTPKKKKMKKKKTGGQHDVPEDDRKFPFTCIVEGSVRIKGRQYEDVRPKFTDALQKVLSISAGSPSHALVFLPNATQSGDDAPSPYIDGSKYFFPDTAFKLSRYYINLTKDAALNPLGKGRDVKVISFSAKIGCEVDDIVAILRQMSPDMVIHGVSLTPKPCQSLETVENVVFTGVPLQIPLEQVTSMMQRVFTGASKILRAERDGGVLEDEEPITLPTFAVVKGAAAHMLYSPYTENIDYSSRKIWKLQFHDNSYPELTQLVHIANRHKLMKQVFGEFASAVVLNENGTPVNLSQYRRQILGSYALSSSVSYFSVPGLMNPSYQAGLEGVAGQVPSRVVSMSEILREVNVTSDNGAASPMFSVVYLNTFSNSYSAVSLVADQRAQVIMAEWLKFPAVQLFHYLKRQRYTQESILRLLRASFDTSALKFIDRSKFDKKSGLAVVQSVDSSSDLLGTLVSRGVSLDCLSSQERAISGVPEGGLDALFKQPEMEPGNSAQFKRGDMSVLSYAQNKDGTSVKTFQHSVRSAEDSISSDEDAGGSDASMCDNSVGGKVDPMEVDNDETVASPSQETSEGNSDEESVCDNVDEEDGDDEDGEEDDGDEDEEDGDDEEVDAVDEDGMPLDVSPFLLPLQKRVQWDSLDAPLLCDQISILWKSDGEEISRAMDGGEESFRGFVQRDDEQCQRLIQLGYMLIRSDESAISLLDGADYLESLRLLFGKLYEAEEERSTSGSEPGGLSSTDGSSSDDGNVVEVVGSDSTEDSDDDDIHEVATSPSPNESIALLLDTIAADYDSSQGGKDMQKSRQHNKAAGSVRAYENRITPLNAKKLGNKKDVLKMQNIGEKISLKIHDFVTKGTYPNYTQWYTFYPPRTAHEAYWNNIGPYTEGLLEKITIDKDCVEDLHNEEEEDERWKTATPLESLPDNDSLLFVHDMCDGDLEKMLSALEQMAKELQEVLSAGSRFVCPPFRPKFQVNTLTTEPPMSSGASDSTADNKHSELLEGSAAADSEDVAG